MASITSQADLKRGLQIMDSEQLPTSKGEVSNQGLHIPDLVVHDGKNIMPTNSGYSSFFGKNNKIGATTIPEPIQDIITYKTFAGNNIQIAFAQTGIYIRSMLGEDTGGVVITEVTDDITIELEAQTLMSWTKVVTSTPSSPWQNWTWAIVQNRLFMFQQGLPYILSLYSNIYGTIVMDKGVSAYLTAQGNNVTWVVTARDNSNEPEPTFKQLVFSEDGVDTAYARTASDTCVEALTAGERLANQLVASGKMSAILNETSRVETDCEVNAVMAIDPDFQGPKPVDYMTYSIDGQNNRILVDKAASTNVLHISIPKSMLGDVGVASTFTVELGGGANPTITKSANIVAGHNGQGNTYLRVNAINELFKDILSTHGELCQFRSVTCGSEKQVVLHRWFIRFELAYSRALFADLGYTYLGFTDSANPSNDFTIDLTLPVPLGRIYGGVAQLSQSILSDSNHIIASGRTNPDTVIVPAGVVYSYYNQPVGVNHVNVADGVKTMKQLLEELVDAHLTIVGNSPTYATDEGWDTGTNGAWMSQPGFNGVHNTKFWGHLHVDTSPLGYVYTDDSKLRTYADQLYDDNELNITDINIFDPWGQLNPPSSYGTVSIKGFNYGDATHFQFAFWDEDNRLIADYQIPLAGYDSFYDAIVANSAFTSAVELVEESVDREYTITVTATTLNGLLVLGLVGTASTPAYISVTAPITTLNPMARISGIMSARGRLGAWGRDNRVRWSSAVDLFDFTPSKTTQANEVTVSSIQGTIVKCLGYDNGFMIYATGNVVKGRYAGGQYVFEFHPVEHATGVIDPRHISSGIGIHYYLSNNGLQHVIPEENVAKPLDGSITDWLFKYQFPIVLRVVSSRFIVLSVHNVPDTYSYRQQRDANVPSLIQQGSKAQVHTIAPFLYFEDSIYGRNLYATHSRSFIFDIVLGKWGTCDSPHKLLYSLHPINQQGYPLEKDYYLKDATLHTELKSLAILDENNQSWIADSHVSDSYVLVGKYRVHRYKHTKLVEIMTEFANLPVNTKLQIEQSIENEAIYDVIDDTRIDAVMNRQDLNLAGEWFNILIRGEHYHLKRLMTRGYRYGR